MAGALSGFLTQVILARHLGPAEFGVFGSVIAAITLLSPLAGMGVGSFWLKIFGKEGAPAMRWVRPSLAFAVLSTIGAIALTLLWAFLGPNDERSAGLFLTLSVSVPAFAAIELASARFQLEERYARLALWQLMPQAFRMVAVVAVIWWFGEGLSTEWVAFVYAGVAMFTLALGLRFMIQALRGEICIKGHQHDGGVPTGPANVANVIRGAWPFGAGAMLYLIFFQSDVVLLKYLAGDVDAGLYNVAFVIIAATYIFPAVVYQKYLLPKFHRWAVHDLVQLRRVYLQGNRLMLILGLSTMVCVGALGPVVIPFVFGLPFSSAVTPLLILSLAIPVRFVAISVGTLLMTGDNMATKLKHTAGVALANLLLNWFLIPHYGMYGAAVSTILSEAALLFLYWGTAKKFLLAGPGVTRMDVR